MQNAKLPEDSRVNDNDDNDGWFFFNFTTEDTGNTCSIPVAKDIVCGKPYYGFTGIFCENGAFQVRAECQDHYLATVLEHGL